MDDLSVLSLLFVEPSHELSIKLLRSDHLIPLSKKCLSARLHRRAVFRLRRIGPRGNLGGGFWSEIRLETSVSSPMSGRTRILICLRLFWFLPRLRLLICALLSGLPLRFLATRFALDNHFIIVRRQEARIVSSSFASFRLARGSLPSEPLPPLPCSCAALFSASPVPFAFFAESESFFVSVSSSLESSNKSMHSSSASTGSSGVAESPGDSRLWNLAPPASGHTRRSELQSVGSGKAPRLVSDTRRTLL